MRDIWFLNIIAQLTVHFILEPLLDVCDSSTRWGLLSLVHLYVHIHLYTLIDTYKVCSKGS